MSHDRNAALYIRFQKVLGAFSIQGTDPYSVFHIEARNWVMENKVLWIVILEILLPVLSAFGKEVAEGENISLARLDVVWLYRMLIRHDFVFVHVGEKLDSLGTEIDVRKISVDHIDRDVDPPHSGFLCCLALNQSFKGIVVLLLASPGLSEIFSRHFALFYHWERIHCGDHIIQAKKRTMDLRLLIYGFVYRCDFLVNAFNYFVQVMDRF